MKRCREEEKGGNGENRMNTAKYLMLLAQGIGVGEFALGIRSPSRVYECKTCTRQFPSFQALGGHRASHKKPRTIADDHDEQAKNSKIKSKIHECSICGLEFALGQALGGHMRRHRSTIEVFSKAPVVKKSNSRRVLCLDLNLTPMENGIEFRNPFFELGFL